MAGITPDGFEAKRFDTIEQELNKDVADNSTQPVDTSADSIAGILHSALARQLTLLWELGEGIYNGGDLLEAEGAQLDDLALNTGSFRLPESRTRGLAWFIGDAGTVINTTSRIGSLAGRSFKPVADLTITSSSCAAATLEVLLVRDSEVYQVSIDNILFSFTSGTSATEEEIIAGLKTQIDTGAGKYLTELSEDLTKLSIKAVNRVVDTLNITATSFIQLSEVQTPAIIESVDFGKIVGDALSVTIIETPVNGWDSVTNYDDLTLGSAEENDDDFRRRIVEDFSTSGSGTYTTAKQKINKVEGVTAVEIIANETWHEDTKNSIPLPPKSYMAVVHGAFVSEDLGQVIWETKPTAIPIIGNTKINIVDKYGQPQTVYYVTPIRRYAYVKIMYTQYTEEQQSQETNSQIIQSCNIYGNSLQIGEDIIPSRFHGDIYRNTTGVGDVSVEIAIDTDPSKDIDDASLQYSSTVIPVDLLSSVTFAELRMRSTSA